MICKKALIVSAIVTVLVIFITIAVVFIITDIKHYNWLMEVNRTEIYESETEYLEIRYQNDGSFVFTKRTKDNTSQFSSGADFISQNVAVYDGKYSLPKLPLFYEFIFNGDTVTLYNNGELVDVYIKVLDNISESSALSDNKYIRSGIPLLRKLY